MLRPVVLAVLMGAVLMGIVTAGAARAGYADGVRAWSRGDYSVAASAFLSAAQAGDRESQFMMGRLYSLGDGVPQNFVLAWLWLDRAARQGHAQAAEARDGLGAILNPQQRAQVQTALAPPPPPAPAPPASRAALQPAFRETVVLVPRTAVVTQDTGRARLAAPAATEEGRLLAVDDPDGMVRALQRALARDGFDPGPIDGDIGSFTRRAIRAYQSAHGEPPNGLVSEAMLHRLGIAELQQAAR